MDDDDHNMKPESNCNNSSVLRPGSKCVLHRHILSFEKNLPSRTSVIEQIHSVLSGHQTCIINTISSYRLKVTCTSVTLGCDLNTRANSYLLVLTRTQSYSYPKCCKRTL